MVDSSRGINAVRLVVCADGLPVDPELQGCGLPVDLNEIRPPLVLPGIECGIHDLPSSRDTC